jgi:hypothetical protein
MKLTFIDGLVAALALAALACGGVVDVTEATSTTATKSGAGGEAAGGEDAVGGGGAEGGAAPVSPTCAGMQHVTLSEPVLTSNGGATWSAGETASLKVTLVTSVDNFDYPGISVTHDASGVGPEVAETWLFGLVAGEPNQLEVGFTADPAVPSGTKVTFQVRVASMVEPCEGLDALTFQAIVE